MAWGDGRRLFVVHGIWYCILVLGPVDAGFDDPDQDMIYIERGAPRRWFVGSQRF